MVGILKLILSECHGQYLLRNFFSKTLLMNSQIAFVNNKLGKKCSVVNRFSGSAYEERLKSLNMYFLENQRIVMILFKFANSKIQKD